MKKLLSGSLLRTLQVVLATLIITCTLHAQPAPLIKWEKSLGGSGLDAAYSLYQTADSGFIVAGSTTSLDGDVTGINGNGYTSDYWIVKLESHGNIVWQKCYGGTADEQANSIQETFDGGFIVAGFTESNDSDVVGNHGHYDYWIVKLSANGDLVWQKCLGGDKDDVANSIQQTADSGYIVAGWSFSNLGDVTGNHGSKDYWVVKLDTGGNIEWQKSLGGTSTDFGNYIRQTFDGGYIVAGFSKSDNANVSGNHGGEDYWIVKLDTSGIIVWEKSLGGSSAEEATSIQQTTDSGYIVAGFSKSIDGDVTGNHGHNDYWILKLDTGGNIIWQKSFGGSDDDYAYSVQQVGDTGFIVTGSSLSTDFDVSGNHGGFIYGDYWIVKLDTGGNIAWQKCLGGGSVEYGSFIQPTAEGRYVVAGYSNSMDGDVTDNHGSSDFWIVQFKSETLTGIASLKNNFIGLYPNPVQTQLRIDLATPGDDVRICVYSLQGKLIALPITMSNTQAELNTAALPDGFYTLQIINNKTGESKTGKFVKGE